MPAFSVGGGFLIEDGTRFEVNTVGLLRPYSFCFNPASSTGI
jgi:hypothetical protein